MNTHVHTSVHSVAASSRHIARPRDVTFLVGLILFVFGLAMGDLISQGERHVVGIPYPPDAGRQDVPDAARAE